jgi:hypothetical protein
MKRYLLFLILLVACQDNEADAPELVTRAAQQIGSSGALLEGEITEVGPVRPITFGFLWDDQSDITMGSGATQYIAGTTSEKRVFSIQLSSLTPATTYYYRSFASDAGFTKIYYGGVVSFTTLP